MGASAPVIGGGVQAYAMGREAQAQTEALSQEASQQRENAKIALENGRFNANKQQLQSEQIFGSMKADRGASGISSDSGSPLEVLRQSYTNAEMDRLTIVYNSEIQSANARSRASALDRQASAINESLPYRQASALLFGAGKSYAQN